MKVALSVVLLFLLVPALPSSKTTDDDLLPSTFLNNVNLMHASGASIAPGGGVLGSRSNGSVLGIDSLTNFSSYFYDPGFRFFWWNSVHLAVHHDWPFSFHVQPKVEMMTAPQHHVHRRSNRPCHHGPAQR